MENITIRGQTIRDVGNVTPRCEAYSEICNSSSNHEAFYDNTLKGVKNITRTHHNNAEVHNSSDTTSLPQDVASFGQEENNDLYSIFEGTHGASMGRDDGNCACHHKPDFVYFGVDDIKHCQRLNKYWLNRAMQAKIFAAQARQRLQRVKECHK